MSLARRTKLAIVTAVMALAHVLGRVFGVDLAWREHGPVQEGGRAPRYLAA